MSQKPIREKIISFLNANKSIFCNYKLIFKLHPMEYNLKDVILDEISESLRDEIIIIKEEKGIMQLQNEGKCQIGAYSTAILEGVQSNLPTLLVDTPLSNHVDFLKALNIKMTPVSQGELISFLESGEGNYNVEYFSKFNENIRDEVIDVRC